MSTVEDTTATIIALWGIRRADQIDPLEQILGWSLSEQDKQEINALINGELSEPVGPEFMAPSSRKREQRNK